MSHTIYHVAGVDLRIYKYCTHNVPDENVHTSPPIVAPQELRCTGLQVRHATDPWEPAWVIEAPPAGSYTLTLTSDGHTETRALVVLPAFDPAGSIIKAVFVGASVVMGASPATAGGFVAECADYFGDRLVLLGTQNNGVVDHEGHSGQYWEWFCIASPLSDGGVVDIANYETVEIADTPTDYFLCIGWGDIFTLVVAGEVEINTAIASSLVRAEQIIAGIQADNPTARIWIATLEPLNQRPELDFSEDHDLIRSYQTAYDDAYIAAFSDREDERVRLVSAHWAADPWHGYGTTDPFHPNDIGHAGMAIPFIGALTYAQSLDDA